MIKKEYLRHFFLITYSVNKYLNLSILFTSKLNLTHSNNYQQNRNNKVLYAIKIIAFVFSTYSFNLSLPILY